MMSHLHRIQLHLLSVPQVMTVEDMSAVCLGCAMKLSHHSASIKTRLAQLQVQPDVSLRTALDGISEVGLDMFVIVFYVCHICHFGVFI